MATTPSSGQLSMGAIHDVFGLGYTLSSYYGAAPGVPASGQLKITDLYGKAPQFSTPSVTASAPNSTTTRLTATSGADTYEWQYDNNSNFSSPIASYQSSFNYTDLSTGNDSFSVRWYFRVRAMYTGGDWSAYSSSTTVDYYNDTTPVPDGD
jgi:hypothetical protein